MSSVIKNKLFTKYLSLPLKCPRIKMIINDFIVIKGSPICRTLQNVSHYQSMIYKTLYDSQE